MQDQLFAKVQRRVAMGEISPPSTSTLGADNKRPCIRIKARIKIQGEHQSLNPTLEATRPYQAYCETITSSRSQSPEVFSTPPTHSEPFQPIAVYKTPTYTARITTRQVTASSTSSRSYRAARLQHASPNNSHETDRESSEQGATVRGLPFQNEMIAQQIAAPDSDQSGNIFGSMSRNGTLSLPQVQQAGVLVQTISSTTTPRTSLRQKRYGRTEYYPLPPLPPSPPDTPVYEEKQDTAQRAVDFSRGEISTDSPQAQKQMKASHRTCGAIFVSPPVLRTSIHHDSTELERPQSKASRRTVTFADDTTISSRSSSPMPPSAHDRTVRQSKSFSSDAQIPSSLRLYRSHDSLLATKSASSNDITTHASRRTAPKDFKHKYHFGQRPPSRTPPSHSSHSLGRSSNPNYNPRLSTSKAQYRGLASLPRPLPSSLRVAQPQTGPRRPPWGSLADLDLQREIRVDARDRDHAREFRAKTLSEATTLGSTGDVDGFGKEKMKREVEEYKEQVMSVYPDMAFDGNAGKGGRRSCCCVVM